MYMKISSLLDFLLKTPFFLTSLFLATSFFSRLFISDDVFLFPTTSFYFRRRLFISDDVFLFPTTSFYFDDDDVFLFPTTSFYFPTTIVSGEVYSFWGSL